MKTNRVFLIYRFNYFLAGVPFGASAATARVVTTDTTDTFLAFNKVTPSIEISPTEIESPISNLLILTSMVSGKVAAMPRAFNFLNFKTNLPPFLTPSD